MEGRLNGTNKEDEWSPQPQEASGLSLPEWELPTLILLSVALLAHCTRPDRIVHWIAETLPLLCAIFGPKLIELIL